MSDSLAALLTALADGATDLTAGGGWPDGVDVLLERLGRAAAADRVWICRIVAEDETSTLWDYVREWAADPALAQLGDEHVSLFLDNYDDPDCARIAAERRQGSSHLLFTEDIEGTYGDRLRLSKVITCLTAPIIVEGEWWGTLGIDDCHTARYPSAAETHAVRAAANLIGASILQQRLRDKRDQFELVLHATDAGYWHWDMSSNQHWWSPELLKLAGLPPTHQHQSPRAMMRLIHPDDRRALNSALQEVLDGGADRLRMDLRIQSTEDQIVWVELLGYLERNGIGAPTRLAGIGIDIRARKREEQRLRERADRDGLTGALNKRAFEVKAELALNAASDMGRNVSLLVLDLDHFKEVNDQYGHAAGDEALTVVAELCRSGLREGDVFGRIGGEEFAVLLPGTETDTACQIAERIRNLVQHNPITTAAGRVNLTVSIGVCSDKGSIGIGPLLHQADVVLYAAKRLGRNQLQVVA